MPRDGSATRERILDAAQKLVLQRGFAATSVDAVLAQASVAKGGFFHHFPSKHALGLALVERYAAADAQTLEDLMAVAEAASDDPAEQLLAFLDAFEAGVDEAFGDEPGCLFAAFVYERELAAPGVDTVIAHSIRLWQERLLEKLEAAAAARPLALAVDLPSLADHVFTVFEGGSVLARALDEPDHLRRQVAHVRHYLGLLLGLSVACRSPAAG